MHWRPSAPEETGTSGAARKAHRRPAPEVRILRVILGLYILLALLLAGLNYGYVDRAPPGVAELIAGAWHFYENEFKTLIIVIAAVLTLRTTGARGARGTLDALSVQRLRFGGIRPRFSPYRAAEVSRPAASEGFCRSSPDSPRDLRLVYDLLGAAASGSLVGSCAQRSGNGGAFHLSGGRASCGNVPVDRVYRKGILLLLPARHGSGRDSTACGPEDRHRPDTVHTLWCMQ